MRATIDVAQRLARNGGLIACDTKRESPAELPGGVRRVAARDLAFDYCDREIVAARTTGGARFEDGASPRKALRLDLLLVARDGRLPVVGEVKLRTDKDPFSALVQAMACASHLATPGQHERLRSVYPEANFVESGQPRIDILLLLGKFPAKATYLPELLKATEGLSAQLLASSLVSASVRRIACLDVPLDREPVSATVRFAFERGES